MERRSVGKRGEGKESAPARGERDYTGLRGELALYRHTDAPITEQSRVVLLLALKTWPRAFNVRCLGLGFVCCVVACVICRVCERRPFTSTASSRIRLFSFFLSRFLLIKLLLNGSTSVVPCSADRMVCVERLIEREIRIVKRLRNWRRLKRARERGLANDLTSHYCI